MNKTIQEEINNNNLLQVMNIYNLQVIHEDNDTYVLEDMSRKELWYVEQLLKFFKLT